MNTLVKLASLGLVGVVVAACGAAPSSEEAGEDTATKSEAVVAGVSGSISATPNPVHVAPGALGDATISWTWSRSSPQYSYACVYVQVDGGTPSVFDCEHPNNHYTPSATWLQAGHTYVFGIIPQVFPVQMTYSNPVPWIASVNVTVVAEPPGETCTSPCDGVNEDGFPVSCTAAAGTTCTSSKFGVTCNGVTTACGRESGCKTCSTR